MRPRDYQKQKVYRSERATSSWDQNKFEHIGAVRKWVQEICESGWYKERFPKYPTIKVIDLGKRRWAARGKNGWIKIPSWGYNKLVVIHEISHAVQPVGTAWHGADFAKIYLDFTKKWLGDKAAEELEVEYKKNGVRYYAT